MSDPRIHDDLTEGAETTELGAEHPAEHPLDRYYRGQSDAALLWPVFGVLSSELTERLATFIQTRFNVPIPTPQRFIERVAATTHEMNRLWCLSLGDESQQPWEEAPDWQRESAIAGVLGVLEGTVTSPEESHQSWMDHKRKDGWTWGPEKNPALKQHPCLVPFHELPPAQRAKDSLFVTIVRTLAPLLIPPAAPEPDR